MLRSDDWSALVSQDKHVDFPSILLMSRAERTFPLVQFDMCRVLEPSASEKSHQKLQRSSNHRIGRLHWNLDMMALLLALSETAVAAAAMLFRETSAPVNETPLKKRQRSRCLIIVRPQENVGRQVPHKNLDANVEAINDWILVVPQDPHIQSNGNTY
jgi:hypothetical protein